MLKIITGTYFPAKKEYINSAICRLISEEKRVYLIVPEQSSFDRDRDFLFDYGEELSNKLTVTSFTHLTRDVLEEYGIEECYFGRIHSAYSLPGRFTYQNIRFTLTSSDFLSFYPLKI